MVQKRVLRRKTVPLAIRMPQDVSTRLREYAERRRLSASAAALQFVDEGLRMEMFPGIDFRWTPGGRCAHVIGTGLAAWELLMIWQDHQGQIKRISKNYPALKPVQIEAAVAYMKAFPEEMPSLEPPPGTRIVRT